MKTNRQAADKGPIGTIKAGTGHPARISSRQDVLEHTPFTAVFWRADFYSGGIAGIRQDVDTAKNIQDEGLP